VKARPPGQHKGGVKGPGLSEHGMRRPLDPAIPLHLFDCEWRYCAHCDETWPATSFYGGGQEKICRDCYNARRRSYRRKDKAA
jgi:hypothetical protein